MALLFCDGFDHYSVADIYQKWTGSWSSFSITGLSPLYACPPGGQGMFINDNNGGRGMHKALPSTYSTLIVGTYMKFTTALPSGVLFGVGDASQAVNGIQFAVGGDGAGHVRAWSNTTLLGTSSNVMGLNTWHHIEAKVTIHNTTGSYEIRVDGVNWLSGTNVNTRQQSTNAWANNFVLTAVGYPMYDDLYILDTSGSVANDFIGPQKIITVYPTGAGTSADFTGNYAANFSNVNETWGDGDVTCNQSATPGDIDLFDFDNVPTGTISAIQHVMQTRQDAGAARAVRAKMRIGGTNYDGTSATTTISHRFVCTPVTVNPADSQAWEAADVNGAEFGYELVS